MNIETSGSKKGFPPANRCIYCGRTDVPLSTEHIIPFGLGGNWVLPKASCSKCQSMTNSFEQPLLRGHFFPARVHLEFPTRHGDPRPEAFEVRFTDDNSVTTVSLSDHPCVLSLQKFVEEPKILSGAASKGRIEVGMWVYAFQPDLHRRGVQLGRPVEPARPMRFGHFVRLLAKIGHSYAVAELGPGRFKPLAVGLIEGVAAEMKLPDRLVGGLRDTINPKDDLHDIWLASYQTKHGHYLVANVQLFASLQGPIYRVVVGEFELKGPGLGRRTGEPN